MKKIKDVSRISGLSKRTLQYYDDIGLLPAKRTKENYRLYDDNDLKRLWKILLYKEAGFELEEISRLLAAHETQQEAFPHNKISTLSAEISKLDMQCKMIKSFIERGLPRYSEKRGVTYAEALLDFKAYL